MERTGQKWARSIIFTYTYLRIRYISGIYMYYTCIIVDMQVLYMYNTCIILVVIHVKLQDPTVGGGGGGGGATLPYTVR